MSVKGGGRRASTGGGRRAAGGGRRAAGGGRRAAGGGRHDNCCLRRVADFTTVKMLLPICSCSSIEATIAPNFRAHLIELPLSINDSHAAEPILMIELNREIELLIYPNFYRDALNLCVSNDATTLSKGVNSH